MSHKNCGVGTAPQRLLNLEHVLVPGDDVILVLLARRAEV